MQKVITFFKDCSLSVPTMVQLGVLMALFTGLGAFLLFCGVKAVLRSKKVGVGMRSSLVILVVGFLGMALAGWVDSICIGYGIQEDKALKEQAEQAESQPLDGTSVNTFTVGEDGTVTSTGGDGGIVVESGAQPEDTDGGTTEAGDGDPDTEDSGPSEGSGTEGSQE